MLERTDTERKMSRTVITDAQKINLNNKNNLSIEDRANARLVAALSGDYIERSKTVTPLDLKKIPKSSKNAFSSVRDMFSSRQSNSHAFLKHEPSTSEDTASTWSSETNSELFEDLHKSASSKTLAGGYVLLELSNY